MLFYFDSAKHWESIHNQRLSYVEVINYNNETLLEKVPELTLKDLLTIRSDLKNYLDICEKFRKMGAYQLIKESLTDFKETLANDKYVYSGMSEIAHVYIDYKDLCYVSLPGCVFDRKFKSDYKETFKLNDKTLKREGLKKVLAIEPLFDGDYMEFVDSFATTKKEDDIALIVHQLKRIKKRKYLKMFKYEVIEFLEEVAQILKDFEL